MSEPFIGQISIFGFNFAPRGWAACNGQILSIAQNTALFSLLGTTYGGNGQTTFALPDLRSRFPNHFGQGPGLSSYDLGQVSGTESTTVTINNMPSHNHLVACQSQDSEGPNPAANFPAKATSNIYATVVDTTMAPTMISNAGGSQPIGIMNPYLTLNYCIALQGIFPSRN